MKYKLLQFITTLCLLFTSSKILSQISEITNYAGAPSIQSPNASTLGKFGDIPVSLFNGTANINIPLTEIKSGSISVDISLQYDSGGCRPDQHPTWVGLSWGLQAGGVIRRITNGKFDESVNPYFKKEPIHFGYYDLHPTLAQNNWSTLTQPTIQDFSPDEFTFAVGNISGKFMLNHLGKWIVQSKHNLNLKVEHEIQTNYSVFLGSANVNIPRSFAKFILTTGDGTKYIFGNQANAIEFSYAAIPLFIGNSDTDPISPDDTNWEYYIQSSAWHLSEIISPSGNKITFHYTTDFSYQQATYSQISSGRMCPWGKLYISDINQTKKYLVKSAYLDKIETDNGQVCTFSKSISNELAWVPQVEQISIPHIFSRQPSYLCRYYKLDGIELKINNNVTKKIAFGYIEKNTERLKLKEVKFLSQSGNLAESIYRMEYNNKPLPVYNSGNEDHWGFYNGTTNYFGIASSQNHTPLPNMVDYYQSREADPSFMDAEIIKRIIYPTGGYSEFTFEPHTYSKLIKQNPTITVNILSENKIAGGLRIKKIETYDLFSSIPQIKEYFYNTNHLNGGSLSSGVLSGEPVYYEKLNNEEYKFSTSPLNYLNTTNGNHVTYTNITEKSSNGYIEYLYTNQDNGYLDKDPINMSPSPAKFSSNRKKLFGKLDLERGQLLSTKYYAEDKFLLKKVLNEYNDDPLRYNNYVRSITDITEDYTCGYNKISIPIYTFYSYLKKVITEEYFRNGEVFNTTINNTYDANSNLLRTTSIINSEGSEIKTRYKYPGDFDFVSLSQIAPANEIHDIAQLQINNIVNVPLEINNSIIKGGVEYITGGKLNYFEDLKLEKTFELETNSHINITNFEFSTVRPSAGFLSDSRYKEKISFIKYDNKGNILEIRPTNGISTSYIWAYNKTHPIAKLFNTTYNQIETLLGVTTLNSLNISYDNAFIKSSTDQLRQGLPSSQVYSYIYNPNIGILSETSPNNNSTNFNYDIFGRLDYITDHTGNIIKKNEYSYKQFKRISLSTNSLNFENVPFGTSSSKSIRVTNSSTQPFTISGLSIPAGYSYIINGSSTVVPGESVDITITFSPSIAGSYPGTITVLSDAEGFNTISVNGSGVISKIINISGNLNFDEVYSQGGNYGQCTYKTITITNTGNTNLTVSGISGVPLPFRITSSWTSGTIAPGQSQNISFSFCPPYQGIYGSLVNIISDKTSGTNTINASASAQDDF